MAKKSLKDEKLSFRITDEQSKIIDNLVKIGAYNSRSDFGQKAISMLLMQEENRSSWEAIISRIIFELVLANRHPAHQVPETLFSKLKSYIRDNNE
jgi:Arc/MetJ-type ribon-helix-helix transcriptional regulator